MDSVAERGKRATFTGKVVSDKMQKSRLVLVERIVKHPKYGKYVKRARKFMVHDESNQTKVGDLVTIVECRPMSRSKRYRIEISK
jgi:small subunit ribosomal protein S17